MLPGLLLGRDLQTLANDIVTTSAGSSSAFEDAQMRVGSNLKRCLGDLDSDHEVAKDEAESEDDDDDSDGDGKIDIMAKPVREPAPKKKAKWFDRDGATTRAIRKEHGGPLLLAMLT